MPGPDGDDAALLLAPLLLHVPAVVAVAAPVPSVLAGTGAAAAGAAGAAAGTGRRGRGGAATPEQALPASSLSLLVEGEGGVITAVVTALMRPGSTGRTGSSAQPPRASADRADTGYPMATPSGPGGGGIRMGGGRIGRSRGAGMGGGGGGGGCGECSGLLPTPPAPLPPLPACARVVATAAASEVSSMVVNRERRLPALECETRRKCFWAWLATCVGVRLGTYTCGSDGAPGCAQLAGGAGQTLPCSQS